MENGKALTRPRFGRHVWLVALAAGIVCLVPSLASAQQIGGTVTDPSGAVLPGVTVEARSPALIEQVRTVVTNEAGQYLIVALETGVYNVTFTLTGFRTVVREGVKLSTGFTANIDTQLPVGSVEETVTVTGDSPVVDIQNVEQRQVIDREVIDSIPSGKSISGYGLLIPGMAGGESWGTPLGHDMGGMSVQSRQRMFIHGGNHEDQQLEINGLDVGDALSQGVNLAFFPDTNMEEMAFQYSGHAADVETGGVRVNMIPKEGGNAFSGQFFTTFTHKNLQANNLDEQQIAAGLRHPNLVDQVWSINPNAGGPIVKDRLWFFVAHSTQRAFVFPAGSYWTANPRSLPLVKDFNDRVKDTSTAREQSINLTWQATRKDKVKAYWTNSSTDQDVYLQGRTLGSIFVAPEAAIKSAIDTNTYQVAWARPQTNRLLLEAGVSHEPVAWTFLPTDRAVSDLPGALTLGPTVAIRNIGGWLQGGATSRVSPKEIDAYRASASYVTGTHNLKVGMSALRQWTYVTQQSNSTPPWTNTLYTGGGFPILAQFSGAFEQAQEAWTWGLYAQDQWRIDRLTMNLGVRWDYNDVGYPDQTRPTNIYFTEPLFVSGETVVTWKDFQPRLGVAYDLFGNGKTALKFSANRYGKRESNDWAERVNPVIANRTQSRSWNDGLTGCVAGGVCIPGDNIPQGDPNNPLPNGELLTPNVNPAWGTPRRTLFFDEDWAFGWGNRPSSWELTGSAQHELMPGMSVDVGYFHRRNINLPAQDDLALGPGDFDTFQVQVPNDPRLPNAGQMITLVDQKRVVTPNEIITTTNNYGGQKQHWNGVDVTIDARRANLLIQGGVSTGAYSWDNCAKFEQLPEMTRGTGLNLILEPNGRRGRFSGETQTLSFCATDEDWVTQLKLLGSYSLPYDFQVAATLQNQPGRERQALVTYSAATIAAALGRPALGGAQVVNVIPAGTEFMDRFTQLDLRFTKLLKLGGRARLRAMFDLYNVLNQNATAFEEPGFGPLYLQPQVIMPGRLGKFAFQIDF
jgi:hypothetical protein